MLAVEIRLPDAATVLANPDPALPPARAPETLRRLPALGLLTSPYGLMFDEVCWEMQD